MIAGPNGSGKSRVKAQIEDYRSGILGHFVNADEIEAKIKAAGRFSAEEFNFSLADNGVIEFLRESSFLRSVGLSSSVESLAVRDGELHFNDVTANSYFASVLADYVRRELYQRQKSFSFETVMSSPDKVQFLREAKAAGYRTYLYYVATRNPSINIDRVLNRVSLGGHPVPADKVRARYERSLEGLLDAIRATDRAYIFDNSGDESVWFAEFTEGAEMEIHAEPIPNWFETYVLKKAQDNQSRSGAI
jgi:predicted ABC-type ATPase